MVSIRSPFWQPFSGPSRREQEKAEYIVDRDYSLPLAMLGVGFWLVLFGPAGGASNPIDLIGGVFHLWFGSFIGKQTMKTRVVFNRDTFELKSVSNKVLGLAPDKSLVKKELKNYVLGTENKWKYDTFVNWDFFPSIQFPVLVYFKETQTPENQQIKGSIGLRQMDRRKNGQMHFFPAFMNVNQVREQFESRGCKKVGPVKGDNPY